MTKIHKGRKMNVRYHKNILYKDRTSQNQVTKGQLSSKNNQLNNFKETPLERASNDISFKGVLSSDKLNKIYDKVFYTRTKEYNYLETIKSVRKYFKKSGNSLLREYRSNAAIRENVVNDPIKRTLLFKEKNPIKLTLEGIVYPFLKLPLHIIDGVAEFLRKRQIISPNAGKNKSTIYGKFRAKLDDDEKFNSLVGVVKNFNKHKFDREKVRDAEIFRDGLKMFDPKSGNYNAVHERALTRIVTGFIPAVFLAKDAYNLSRICDDNATAAEKEKKVRFNQETKRVVGNAYLQLITLGALAKFVNASKTAYVAVTILTTLATETYSRLSNGKKIHFISKDEAKEINKKAREKNGKNSANVKINSDNKTADFAPAASKEKISNPAFKESKVFKDFSMATKISFRANEKNSPKTDNKDDKEMKPLLSLNSVLTWILGTIALGYAIRGSKAGIQKLIKNPKYNNSSLVKNMKSIDEKIAKGKKNIIKFLKLEKVSGNTIFEKFYNKITTKENVIDTKRFIELSDNLKEYDKNFGDKFGLIVRKFQKGEMLKSFALELAADIEKIEAKTLDQQVKLKNYAKEFKIAAQGKLSKEREAIMIRRNFNDFYKKLCQNGETKMADEIKGLLFNQNGDLIGSNYSAISKLLKKSAKARPKSDLAEFVHAFDGVFKVDVQTENYRLYNKFMADMKKNDQWKIVEKYQSQMLQSIAGETVTLGRTNKFIIKEAVDFVIQPFKFIWSTVTFPYKLMKKFEKAAKPTPLPKWKPEIETVANSFKKLEKTYKNTENYVNFWNKKAIKHNQKVAAGSGKEIIEIKDAKEEFAKIMNKTISKAFNTVTMSSVSNSDLSELAKYSTTAATAWFLIADNHNMVMLKSDGENKKDASLKGKERAVQETSRLFYNQLWINLFNSTFRNVYNGSLFGAEAVNTASTILGEYTNRKAIGVPVSEMSRDEILKQDYENLHSKGAKGKFFRFMSRLTGKRALTQREQAAKPKDKENIEKK